MYAKITVTKCQMINPIAPTKCQFKPIKRMSIKMPHAYSILDLFCKDSVFNQLSVTIHL